MKSAKVVLRKICLMLILRVSLGYSASLNKALCIAIWYHGFTFLPTAFGFRCAPYLCLRS